MKKYILSIIVGIAIVSALALSLNASMLSGSISNHDIPSDYILPTSNSTIIPKEIVIANNDFAIDFYKQISDNDENQFFSPVSMYTAFSVLYEGARGNTAEQIQQVFGFEPDFVMRHNSTVQMISAINRDDPHATLDIANALWIADWFTPYDSYLKITRDVYSADAQQVDFTDADDGVKKINEWAAEKTHDKIKEVITKDDVDGNTAMVINNAIYFKGTWLTQFSVDDTRESKFWKEKTTSVSTDFMNTEAEFNYTHSNGAQVIKLPYDGDRLSMVVILPDEKNAIKSLEDTITSKQIEQWNNEMVNQNVIVSMPKFEMKTNYQLNNYLKELGMTDAFNKYLADLSGIASTEPGNLYVFKATQDAYVKVNEEGTEAAAVTTIIILALSEPPTPPHFIADHPFLFIISDDQSGAILFMGKVSDPS